MKTAIYIEDGVVQLVLTPETDWEKSALKSFIGKPTTHQIFNGSFYDCRGGWTRQTAQYFNHFHPGDSDKDDHSLILRVQETKTTPVSEDEGPLKGATGQ